MLAELIHPVATKAVKQRPQSFSFWKRRVAVLAISRHSRWREESLLWRRQDARSGEGRRRRYCLRVAPPLQRGAHTGNSLSCQSDPLHIAPIGWGSEGMDRGTASSRAHAAPIWGSRGISVCPAWVCRAPPGGHRECCYYELTSWFPWSFPFDKRCCGLGGRLHSASSCSAPSSSTVLGLYPLPTCCQNPAWLPLR